MGRLFVVCAYTPGANASSRNSWRSAMVNRKVRYFIVFQCVYTSRQPIRATCRERVIHY